MMGSTRPWFLSPSLSLHPNAVLSHHVSSDRTKRGDVNQRACLGVGIQTPAHCSTSLSVITLVHLQAQQRRVEPDISLSHAGKESCGGTSQDM